MEPVLGQSGLQLGAGPERWGGVTLLLSMRDRAKELDQRAEAWCPAFCYGWGQCHGVGVYGIG